MASCGCSKTVTRLEKKGCKATFNIFDKILIFFDLGFWNHNNIRGGGVLRTCSYVLTFWAFFMPLNVNVEPYIDLSGNNWSCRTKKFNKILKTDGFTAFLVWGQFFFQNLISPTELETPISWSNLNILSYFFLHISPFLE